MQRKRRPLRKVRNSGARRSAKEFASALVAHLWPQERRGETRHVSVLLDNAIYSLTNTVQAVGRDVKVVAGSDQTVTVAGIQSKPRYGPSASWKQAQIDSLPTIMRLACDGRIRVCTYHELTLERLGQKIGCRGMKGDLMKDVRPEHVPAAIGRGHFQQAELFESATRERVVEYCKLLLQLRYEVIEPYPEFMSRFTEFELRNLQSLDRFRELCLHISEKHYPDVFHLWTAETNGLDYFLTTDQKFINAMARKKLTAKPIAPSDLVTVLGVKRLDPLPFSEGKWHPIYEAW